MVLLKNIRSWVFQLSRHRPSMRARARPLMILLAGLLAVSLLPLSGSASLGAANTAVEGSLDVDGSRIFAGATRYETSVALATQFLRQSPRQVDEIFVVSGETGVDAFSAVGWAAARDTTIVLTRQNSLPAAVREFIEDWGFRYVTIVGDTGAVSAAVEEELRRTGSVIGVERFGGADRYVTSAITATDVGRPGYWCGTSERVMFMIGGHSLADGTVVAPVATKMETSILQVPQDGLPNSVARVLRDQPVNRVVLVASEAEVGHPVVRAIERLDISVTRVGGATPVARSVELAELVSAPGCGLVEEGNIQYALVYDEHAPGAATLGAPLASTVAFDGSLVSVLLVGRHLPREVRVFLESIPSGSGARPNDVVLHAIGGPEAVTPSVMRRALEAALASRVYLATIDAEVGSNVIRVTFSESVNQRDATNRSNFWLGGGPLLSSDTVEYFGKVTTITLDGYQLRAGDRIRVVGGRIRVASSRTDNRLVAEANLRLPTPRDRTAPHVEVLAVPGRSTIWISVDDDNPLEDPLANPDRNLLPAFSQLTLDEVTLTLGGTRITAEAEGVNNRHGLFIIQLPSGFPSPISGRTQTRFAIRWGCSGFGGWGRCDGRLAGDSEPTTIAVGDRIEIDAGAFLDAFNNRSRAVNHRVTVPTGPPTLVGTPVLDIRPTSLTPGVNPLANPTHAQVVVAADAGGRPGRVQFRIVAKGDGGFPGAMGNSWYLVLNKVSDEEGPHERPTPEVTVDANARRQVLRVTFDDEASVADILGALRQDQTVDETFEVIPDEAAMADPLFTTSGVDLYGDVGRYHPFSGGLSRARLTLTYSQHLSDFDHAAFIEAQVSDGHFGPASDESGIMTVAQTTPGGTPLSKFNLPTVWLYWLYSGTLLPESSSTFNLPAGVATDSWGRRSEEVRANVQMRLIN